MDAMYQDLYGNYRNRKFSDIWGTAEAFLLDYKSSGITANITEDNALLLYYLLYSKYGNSTIASSDENQFKYKVYSTIFMYGPTWEKKLQIQNEIRSLSLEELMEGGKAVYNKALNPSQPVASGTGASEGEGTNTLDELTFINEQNTTKYKKSRADAYALLLALLETDVTEAFISRFKKLFLTVVSPERPLWYETDIIGGIDNDD